MSLFTIIPPPRIVGVVFAAWLAALAVGAALRTAHTGAPAGPDARVLAQAGRLLHAYRDAAGAYPSTGGKWVLVPDNALPGADLDPKIMAQRLASAPAWESVPESAVIYRSDGKDFKLVRHNPPDCTAVHAREPGLVDPVRTAYARAMIPGGWVAGSADERRVAPLKDPALRQDPDIPDPLYGKCWAYGVWTPGAVFW